MDIIIDKKLIKIIEPTPYAVYQRQEDGLGTINVKGCCNISGTAFIEVSAVSVQGGTDTEWHRIEVDDLGVFSGRICAAGGLYRVVMRPAGQGGFAMDNSMVLVDKVGVGEVFITAGQSNSCAASDTLMIPEDDRVCATSCDIDDKSWRFGADPLPSIPAPTIIGGPANGGSWYGQGDGGSFMPPLGDLLVKELNVPVGFIMCGEGGSFVSQWLPDGVLYPRIKNALKKVGVNGARAILWHQGESDAGGTTTADYQCMLTSVIGKSRENAGWNIPWGVAIASYLPPRFNPNREFMDNIRAAQMNVIENVSGVFRGPDTDVLAGKEYRCNQDDSWIHFNGKGLQAHAKGWFETIMSSFFVKEPCYSLSTPSTI